MENWSALAPVGQTFVSFMVGMAAFYLLVADESTARKRQLVAEMSSQLIHFVILMYMSKIILKFTVFIKDPMAVLAYPSNAPAFYLALVFSAVILAYKAKRQQMDVLCFMYAFMQVFFISSFVYEFIEIVWNQNRFSIGYLFLLALLVLLFLLIRQRRAPDHIIMIMLSIWTVGKLTLAILFPFTTVFGYTIAPWFIIVFYMTCLAITLWHRRKETA